MPNNAKRLFEILVREHSQTLLAYLRAAGCSNTEAEDLWQETMLVAWKKLDAFDQTKPFGPWLRGIAAKLLLAANRKRQRLGVSMDEAMLEQLSSRVDTISNLTGDTLHEKLQVLRDCLTTLPQLYKQCLELRFLQGFKAQEIGNKLRTELATVNKRLHRAKERLRICMVRKLPSLDSDGSAS